ncbi:phosphatidylinositide phosphatase SAC2 [Condylostylus longicornis]|uniref:phosphatidylinositide phosphatase SAC2 n=1 Tax=Condylostylus longicornis TaxID=2530218 RepID=UPI00244DAF1D|nr:phosphatidylinositide phosphatase SAC2 [Condylostylus longicornis]
MEVFQTDQYYIFVKREKSLWWNRTTSEFKIKAGWDLSSVDDIECLGITLGIVGVINLPGVYEPHLVIIKEASPVGVLYPPNLVYKIKSICVLGSELPDSTLTTCPRHKSSRAISTPSSNRSRLFESSQLMNKTWGAVKSAGTTIKNTTQHAAAIASNQVKSTVGIRDPTRIEKKITEELHKIFDDTDSFYFCPDGDITNNLQRRSEDTVDERFFWNKHMVENISVFNDKTWILPIIQGFVQVEHCVIGEDCFTLALVSRRSRHRAGTRYKRRGVDVQGFCANYVETEQILSFRHHQMSFTQVRGSVPVYWSQPGYKYRPPPRLDRDETETQVAFEKHFNQELDIYKNIVIINLVEQTGKEKVIADSYATHIVKYNSDRLIYVTFDFHDYCRGMRFENVSVLVEALAPEAGAMGFHWRDGQGTICNQKAVFRVNCMDCLDRTNIVQTALGKAVLESQLVKLGLAPPYTPIPEQLKNPFMVLWANNGDVISRQYAGTNALKGDYTRTGERKLTGMVKDGMNSANRYYLARFKDSYRQATIDLMLGNPISAESLNALGGQQAPDETDASEGAEHAKLLVEDCRRLLLGSAQYPIGSWGLIDADPNTGDFSETEVDTVLLLTSEYYIVAEYDSHLDKIIRFEKVQLENVTLIELGMYQHTKIFQGNAQSFLCLRINYVVDGIDGFFQMFRSANLRFFNNVAVPIKSDEEIMESLASIVEFFRIALETIGKKDVKYVSGGVLQKKSKQALLDIPKNIPRNLSESQLVQMSSKAISNVAGQFSKLGQSFHSNKKSNKTAKKGEKIETGVEAKEKVAVFTLGSGNKHKTSDESSDDEDHDNSIYEPNSEMDAPLIDFGSPQDFLPSVGIVMSTSNTNNDCSNQNYMPTKVCQLENKDNTVKMSEDVLTVSITSVMDHINLPAGLLENSAPVCPRSPTPEIRIHAITNNELKQTASANETRSCSPNDLSLHLSGSQSDNTIKQLKTLTSPLSKLAKGVQNLGMNLDPRKKTGIQSPVEPHGSPEKFDSDKLYEIWKVNKCRTKLIAL